jgi:galactokinase
MYTHQKTIDRVNKGFYHIFDSKPELILRSPGRINLIGEHTDYNNGFVLPAAIDKSIYFAFRKNQSNLFQIHALDTGEHLEFNPANQRQGKYQWAHFLQGGLWALNQLDDNLSGVDLVFGSDLPIGAGLSSSSALTCGFIYGMNILFEFQISRFDTAMMGHQVEREFLGLKGGIMDQFANMLSKPDHFLLLDCRSREYSLHQLRLDAYKLVMINTRVSHKLMDSDYNVRADESAKAVEVIRSHHPEVESLRDVDLELVLEMKPMLGDILYRRADYVIRENMRVLDTIQALERNDYERLGANLFASHNGLKDDYEVSCPELDFLVDCARSRTGVAGSRMMGGGFGGCTLNLVKKEAEADFLTNTMADYREHFRIDAEVIDVQITGGTEVVG